MNFDIHKLIETPSTNDDAKRSAEAGAAEGTVFWALCQKAGRGRQGRQWDSPEGNLYCSVILRPATSLSTYGLYSFVAGLALFDVVRHILPDSKIELKWPNDVLVDGKKISGILLEATESYLITGMGLNVRHSPQNPLYPVTSLSSESPDIPSLEVILTRLLDALGYWVKTLQAQGFAPVRAAWLDRARKGSVRVRLPNAEIQGEFGDLDVQGNLCLILPDKTEYKVNAGDVFF